MCYMVKNIGKTHIDPEKLKEYNVKQKDIALIKKNGKIEIDGKTITESMLLKPPDESKIMYLLYIPSLSYIKPLLCSEIMKQKALNFVTDLIYVNANKDVLQDPTFE